MQISNIKITIIQQIQVYNKYNHITSIKNYNYITSTKDHDDI